MKIDLSKTIEAKSDHLSSDDLIGKVITIKITRVSVNNSDRPVVIDYEGSNGKPYLPCKSMRRLMVAVWGADGAKYVGQSLTLYRDPTVTFGKIEVGGIRISHMTGIKEKFSTALTATRGRKKMFSVEPLIVSEDSIDDILNMIKEATTPEALNSIYSRYKTHSEVNKIISECSKKKKDLTPPVELDQEIIPSDNEPVQHGQTSETSNDDNEDLF